MYDREFHTMLDVMMKFEKAKGGGEAQISGAKRSVVIVACQLICQTN